MLRAAQERWIDRAKAWLDIYFPLLELKKTTSKPIFDNVNCSSFFTPCLDHFVTSKRRFSDWTQASSTLSHPTPPQTKLYISPPQVVV